MIEVIVKSIVSIIVGLALGGIFFGGLWWTVRRLTTSKKPGLLVFGSFVVRSLALLVGFFAVATYGGLVQLLIALIACLSVRFFMVHKIRPHVTPEERAAPEVVEPAPVADEPPEEPEHEEQQPEQEVGAEDEEIEEPEKRP